jgi:hypothetical protein
MTARPVILETPRLQLRELLDEDVPLVQGLLPACDLVPRAAPPAAART